MVKIDFSDITNDNSGKLYRKTVAAAARETLKAEGEKGDFELSVTVCNDDRIHELNKEFRKVDRPTDVLSFPASDDLSATDPENGAVILGDIVISIDTALKQAQEYGNTPEREISFLTIHGCLHLLGFDHEISEDEEKIMFGEQKIIIKKLFGEEK